MRRFRFTIGSMLVLVLYLGIAFAALRQATPLWDQMIFTGTLGLLVLAVLLAVHRRDRSRAFWLGFAIGGSIYFACSVIPAIESRLVTRPLLTALAETLPKDPMLVTAQLNGTSAAPTRVNFVASPSTVYIQGPTPTARPAQVVTETVTASGTTRTLNLTLLSEPSEFYSIGHLLLALAIAFAGGKLSLWLFVRERSREEPQPA